MSSTKLTHITAFTVTGLPVRTTNNNEFNPDTAKLPQLWRQFSNSKLSATSPMYGVYSEYESDLNGHYTVTAGIKTANTSEFSTVYVLAGDYLVFETKGPIPQVVVEAWKQAWLYFENSQQYERAYLTDFEEYRDNQEFALYIGIKSKKGRATS